MNGKTGLATVVMSVSMSLMASLPDPIGWWKMDAAENGVVADLSGNGRDLTLGTDCSLSNVVYGLSKKTISTLYFNGTANSYASFQCPALTSRTITFWTYRETEDGPLAPEPNEIPYYFVAVSTMNFSARLATVDPPTGEVFFSGYDGSSSYYPKAYTKTSRAALHHIAIVVSVTGRNGNNTYAGSVITYVDGAKYEQKDNCTFPASLARA